MEKITFPPARIGLAGLTLFWTGNLGFVLFLLAAPWHQTEMAVIVTCIICGLILAPFVAIMLALCARTLMLHSVITLTQHGVTDHRISHQELRWQDLRWQTYPKRKGGPEIMVQSVLLEPRLPLTRVFWPYRLLARFYGSIGMPAYPVMPFGTGLSADEIAQAFARFKKPT